jgi:hypothetical protein
MVTLNTLLLVGLIAAGVAAVATVAFFMLLGVYLSVKEMKKDRKEEEDESGTLTLPMSVLQSMGGGAPRPLTQADVDRARAAMAQMNPQGGAAACPDGGCPDGGVEKKEAYVPGGYL